jgi:hypothetical protein
LQRSAGNQAVSGLIPIQRKLSEKLDGTTADGRAEDDFLGIMGRVLGENWPNNPVVESLLQKSTVKSDRRQNLGGGDVGGKSGVGTPTAKATVSPTMTLAQKQAKVAALKTQLNRMGVPLGVTKGQDIDEQITQLEKKVARKEKQDELAKLKRRAAGNLTEKEKAELKEEQEDAKLEAELAKTKSLAEKKATLAELKASEGKTSEEDELDKQIKEQQKHNKLVADEQESKEQWAALAKKPNPTGKWGGLPGDTGSAYQKSEDAQKKSLDKAGKNQVETIDPREMTLSKRFRNSFW